jgi:uncharacterized membrane protein YfcA
VNLLHLFTPFDLLAVLFGVAIGAIGTLVGVGGGFLIVPAVVLIQPTWETRTVTAFSLAVVCANACSGTLAYVRQGRVDVRSAIPFAAAAIPGVFLGVLGADKLERGWFDPLFGVLLLLMAGWLALKPHSSPGGPPGRTRRELVDAHGRHYAWTFDMRLGLAGSVVVGVISALFGIGGGPIQVPFLVAVLDYPEHVATATSHAVLAVTSLVALVLHALQGDYAGDLGPTLATALGAVLGAPIGARLSRYVSGETLMRILAAMLAFIAFRLLWRSARDVHAR